MSADLVFLNGTVITVDEEEPTAEAVAVVGNRIARVGGSDEMRDEAGPATRVIDLEGRTLLPGFNDNHTHPISYGLGLSLIDARPGTIPSRRIAGGVPRRGHDDADNRPRRLAPGARLRR
jgi:predicted amidohydrolase YtcJ